MAIVYDKPIEDFWKWWASAGRAAAEAGMRDCEFGAFDGEMNARVEAVHADLAWELMPGGQAEHALVVTAAGVPGRRRIAERWFRDAPPADEAWEYHPARQASLSSRMAMVDLNGWKLDLSKLTFDLQVDGDVIDTVVFHPGFAAMPPEACDHVGFLVLDWALGEDDVTRWIGEFGTTSKRPAAGVLADGLVEAVRTLARRAGAPRWAQLQMQRRRDGAIVLASVARPAKWVDHPLLDLHMTVALPFAERTPAGLPGPGSLGRLRDFEDRLTGWLLPHIRLVAHETTQGSRTFHLYGDSDDPALAGRVRDFTAGWPGATVNASPDPGWRAIRHLTG
jgi:hypothetical protein